MILPKFSYNDGSAVNFTPAIAPKGKYAQDALDATRHDSITSSGKKQSVVENIANLQELNFPFVPDSDISSWNRFFAWALGGGQFDYYPDSTSGTKETMTLEDTNWTPAFTVIGYYTFKFRMRKVV